MSATNATTTTTTTTHAGGPLTSVSTVPISGAVPTGMAPAAASIASLDAIRLTPQSKTRANKPRSRTMQTARKSTGGKAPRKQTVRMQTARITTKTVRKKQMRVEKRARPELEEVMRPALDLIKREGQQVWVWWEAGTNWKADWYRGKVKRIDPNQAPASSSATHVVQYADEATIIEDKEVAWLTDDSGSGSEGDETQAHGQAQAQGPADEFVTSCTCGSVPIHDPASSKPFCGIWLGCESCLAGGHAECAFPPSMVRHLDLTSSAGLGRLNAMVKQTEWLCPLCEPHPEPAPAAAAASASAAASSDAASPPSGEGELAWDRVRVRPPQAVTQHAAVDDQLAAGLDDAVGAPPPLATMAMAPSTVVTMEMDGSSAELAIKLED